VAYRELSTSHLPDLSQTSPRTDCVTASVARSFRPDILAQRQFVYGPGSFLNQSVDSRGAVLPTHYAVLRQNGFTFVNLGILPNVLR